MNKIIGEFNREALLQGIESQCIELSLSIKLLHHFRKIVRRDF